jgi:glutamate N-acetyltransferase/amino-acid N-acetyltransferase
MNPLNLQGRAELPLGVGTLTDVPGVRCGATAGGIKKPGTTRDDVAIVLVEGPHPAAAAVTTVSTAAAASCKWTRARVPSRARAIVVNSGNANASTGAQGIADNAAMAARAAAGLGLSPDEVLVCSTGVIGVPLPMDRLLPAISRAAELGAGGERVARAILTTDLTEKSVYLQHEGITVAGVAKGSGMIHPGMATMLGFVVTDAHVDPVDLQRLTEAVNARTFNAISVDGDMSTNDTLIVLATGAGPRCDAGTPAFAALEAALDAACRKLARDIAADGEGATCRVDVVLHGGPDDATARAWARAIICSSLVKAAIHGRDANWGRVVGALGQAGAEDLDLLDLDFAGVPVLRGGRPVAFDEAAATAGLKAPVVQIHARLPGPGRGEAWGCDLSAQYVAINADYRS